MKLPPWLIRMKVREEGRTKVRLWLPLFLLWPLMLVAALLFGLAAVLADVYQLATGNRRCYLRLFVGCAGILCETRGTEVSVVGEDRSIAFILK